MNELNHIPSIKVFSCDHRKIDTWRLPFIRVGTGFNNNSAIKDSIEDNILEGYDQLFSEGTAMWWVYKHIADFGNPDYVGFCHYRRFLTLLKPNYNPFPICVDSSKNLDTLLKFILTPEQQLAIILKYGVDGILPASFPDHGYFEDCKDIREVMKAESDRKDIQLNMTKDLCDKAFDVLLDNTPDNFKTSMEKTFTDLNGYHFNMFTIKRELFDIYNSIIWKSCFDIEKYAIDNNIQNLNPRWIAYLLERYTSCMLKMFNNNGSRFVEVPMLMLEQEKYK